jgi:DNA replication protein DnaC
MFAELKTGRAEGRYARLFRTLTRANFLILDDWGTRPAQRRSAP